MREIKLEVHNVEGAVVEEGMIKITEGSKLILKAPKYATVEQMKRIFDRASYVLKDNDTEVLVLPHGIDVQVLHVD